MRVAASAIGTDFTGPDLMPRLGHVEDQPVFVQSLKRERHVGRDAGQKAGVRIAVRIEGRAGRLAERNLAQDPEAFKLLMRAERGIAGAVAAMGDALHHQDAHGVNVGIGVQTGIGALGEPVVIGVVLRGVERIQTAKGRGGTESR